MQKQKDSRLSVGSAISENTDGPFHSKKSLKEIIRSFVGNFFLSYYRYSIIQVGFLPSHTIRNFLYKFVYAIEFENNVTIYYGAEIRGSWNLKIGKGSIIGDKSILDARCGIYIGENVNISSNVSMWTDQHDYNDPYFGITPGKHGAISIGNRAWIGPNVTILHSIAIGEGAVIAAGAVVTKNVEPFALYGGIPAKKIGERNRDLKYVFDSSTRGMFY